MSTDYMFQSILNRFISAVTWCAGVGAFAGLIYWTGSPTTRRALLEILAEHSSHKTFHFLAVFVTLFLGATVALFGRQSNPSKIRIFLCYRPADVALSLCAVFVGLVFGFGVGVHQAPLVFGAIAAFFFSGFLLLGVLRLSFAGAVTKSENYARIAAVALSICSPFTFWWAYRH